MPNSRTFSIKPIRELIQKYANGYTIDPFAAGNRLANVTNDIDPQYDTDFHMDAHKACRFICLIHCSRSSLQA